MARYVLLAIADNAAAEAYVASLQSEAKNLIAVPLEDDPAQYRMTAIDIEVAGLYAKPTSFCPCEGDRMKFRNVRGAKLGWHVHDVCGKPVRHTHQIPNNLLLEDRSLESRGADPAMLTIMPDETAKVTHRWTYQQEKS